MALAVAGFACLTAAAEDKVGIGSPAPTFLLPTINAEACGRQRAGVEQGAPGDGAGRPRAYLVSFFSVDCKPCRHELPQLKNIHQELAAQGLSVVVVGVDALPEKIAEAQKLVAELALPFPVVRDRFQVVQRRYQVDTLPTLFVIDERNVVRLRIVGYDPKTALPVEELKKALSDSGAQRR
jgi:thiol-disulfide isomerase/thioredoxin